MTHNFNTFHKLPVVRIKIVTQFSKLAVKLYHFFTCSSYCWHPKSKIILTARKRLFLFCFLTYHSIYSCFIFWLISLVHVMNWVCVFQIRNEKYRYTSFCMNINFLQGLVFSYVCKISSYFFTHKKIAVFRNQFWNGRISINNHPSSQAEEKTCKGNFFSSITHTSSRGSEKYCMIPGSQTAMFSLKVSDICGWARRH